MSSPLQLYFGSLSCTRKANTPIIAFLDSNSDTRNFTYPIPVNTYSHAVPQVPFALVFTKTDKRKKRCPTAEKNIAAFQGQLLSDWEVPMHRKLYTAVLS